MLVEMVISIDISGFTLLASKKNQSLKWSQIYIVMALYFVQTGHQSTKN